MKHVQKMEDMFVQRLLNRYQTMCYRTMIRPYCTTNDDIDIDIENCPIIWNLDTTQINVDETIEKISTDGVDMAETHRTLPSSDICFELSFDESHFTAIEMLEEKGSTRIEESVHQMEISIQRQSDSPVDSSDQHIFEHRSSLLIPHTTNEDLDLSEVERNRAIGG